MKPECTAWIPESLCSTWKQGVELTSPLKVKTDLTGIVFLIWSGRSHSLYSRNHEIIIYPVACYQCHVNCSERKYLFWPSQTIFLIQANLLFHHGFQKSSHVSKLPTMSFIVCSISNTHSPPIHSCSWPVASHQETVDFNTANAFLCGNQGHQ